MATVNLIPYLSGESMLQALLAEPSILEEMKKEQIYKFIEWASRKNYELCDGQIPEVFIADRCDFIIQDPSSPNIKEREKIEKFFQLREALSRVQIRYIQLCGLGYLLGV